MISIVVPVYNEEKSISRFVKELVDLKIDYEVVFVCDPSSDETIPKLKELSNEDPKKYKTILMSRRFGQHACIIAGLNHSLGDAVVVMDIDGQDPVSLLPNMIEKWQEGYEVVYARRTKREGLNIINKLSAKIGLYLISKLSYIDIPRNVGEYRLMDKRVVNELLRFNEQSPFLRGMVSYVGFTQTSVEFTRPDRSDGVAKYNKFFGSISFGITGLISFSSKPLVLSFLFFISFFILFVINIFTNIFSNLNGVTSLILLIGSLQFLSLSIIGMYIANINNQVLNRPSYIIDQFIGDF
tara:strand:+ start:10054 stop:10944 length:891 start_codon:yes stop_codon:yes gene_type:complete